MLGYTRSEYSERSEPPIRLKWATNTNEVSRVTRRQIGPSEYFDRDCPRHFSQNFPDGLVFAIYFTNCEELCHVNELSSDSLLCD